MVTSRRPSFFILGSPKARGTSSHSRVCERLQRRVDGGRPGPLVTSRLIRWADPIETCIRLIEQRIVLRRPKDAGEGLRISLFMHV
jgi:hypothetical protein